MYKIEVQETFPKFKDFSPDNTPFTIILSYQSSKKEIQLTDDLEKINQAPNQFSVCFEFPEPSSDKKLNKDKKEEKVNVQLLKNQTLIGSQDVVFALDNKKAKNNEFKKWLTFNLTNNNANNNIISSNINNSNAQTAGGAKGKDGKRGSLTGISLINFSEFVKIYVSISKIDEESKQKILLQEKLSNKEADESPINNLDIRAEDKEVYINIQENEENNNDLNTVENVNGNENENQAIKPSGQSIADDKEKLGMKEDLVDKKTDSAKGKGKNRSNLKQINNLVLTEGNNEEAYDKKLKDSAKKKDLFGQKKPLEEKTKKENVLDKSKKNHQVSSGSGSNNNLVLNTLSNGLHLNKQAPNTTRNASGKNKKFNITSPILSNNNNNAAEAHTPSEAEKASSEAKLSDQLILNNLPDGKESALWENTNLILSENTKNLDILEHKNHLEILEENEKTNSCEYLETPVNSKIAPNSENINSINVQNELLITQNPENIELDSNEKKSINNVIENINKFMDSNSSPGKTQEKKKTDNKVKSSHPKEKKSSKKIESKRLKDLLSEGDHANGENMHIEGNIADIHDIKNKILRNNNFQSKKFREIRASIGKSNNTNEKKPLESEDFKEFYTNISSNLKGSNFSTKASNLKNGQSSGANKGKNVRILGSYSGKKNSIKKKLDKHREFQENDEVSITSIDSFLEDDYASKNKIAVEPNIPFDEINLNAFNQEYEKFKDFIFQEDPEGTALEEEKLKKKLKDLVENLNNFQSLYYRSISDSVKNNQKLREILKEYLEKTMNVKKKTEKLIHINEHNKIKNQFSNLNESEKVYISKTVEINKLEKSLYKTLLGNVIEKNEAEKAKKDELKAAMLAALKNSLAKKNFEEVKKPEIKTAISYLNEKFNLNLEIPKFSYIDDEISNKESSDNVAFRNDFDSNNNNKDYDPKTQEKRDISKSPEKNKAQDLNGLKSMSNGNELINQYKARERSSILNKNYLESKVFSIYTALPTMPQIEFKKISETDYLYGTMKIGLNIDVKNPSNINVLWRKNNIKITTPVEEFLKFNAQIEDEKLKRTNTQTVKKSFNKKDTIIN